MPWSQPVERMRELVLAIRAIWATWHEGTPLDFRGEFYRHTLMTPFFNPGPSPYGLPSIFLGGRRPADDRDGRRGRRRVHRPPVRDRDDHCARLTIPALERGAAKARPRARRRRDRVPARWRSSPTPTSSSRAAATRCDPASRSTARRPRTRSILDVHGWGDLQPELNRLSKTGDWATMSVADHRRDGRHVRGAGHARRRSAPSCASATATSCSGSRSTPARSSTPTAPARSSRASAAEPRARTRRYAAKNGCRGSYDRCSSRSCVETLGVALALELAS